MTQEALEAAHKQRQEEFNTLMTAMLEDPSGVTVEAYIGASKRLQEAFFAAYPTQPTSSQTSQTSQTPQTPQTPQTSQEGNKQ
jgi:hypothetical protein